MDQVLKVLAGEDFLVEVIFDLFIEVIYDLLLDLDSFIGIVVHVFSHLGGAGGRRPGTRIPGRPACWC